MAQQLGLGGGRVPYPSDLYVGPFAGLLRDAELERPTQKTAAETHRELEEKYQEVMRQRRMAEEARAIRTGRDEFTRREDLEQGYAMAHPNEPRIGPVTALARHNTELM